MKPSSRLALAVLAGALSALVPAPVGSAPPTPVASSDHPTGKQGRPNVVVIMADDMRVDDLRWMPKTRRLIGAAGARFTNSFAPFPLCCPARASFLTGRYTHNHEVWSHEEPYGFAALDDARTLPVWLRASGYRTLFLGKYLNGYGKQRLPGGRSSVRYVPPGWSDWRGAIDGGLRAKHPLSGGTYRYFDTTLNVNGRLRGHQGRYSTRMLGGQSVGMIRRYARSDRPFFLWASYVAPHHGAPGEADDPALIKRSDGKITKIVTPAVPSGVRGRFDRQITRAPGLPAEADVSDKPHHIRSLPPLIAAERRAMREAARQRAESLAVLDVQVGRTVDALRRAGELRNTVVLFTSDNGYFQGEHRMRQGKMLPYEPSLRVPLLMRGPGIPAGVTRADPFLSIDFAPTILAIAKAPLRGAIDGRSRLGIARFGDNGWDRPVLTESAPRDVIAHANEAGSPLAVRQDVRGTGPYSVGVRTQRFLYVKHLSGGIELYDMRTDPRQLRNVAGRDTYAADQTLLAAVLADLRKCVGGECRRPMSSWTG